LEQPLGIQFDVGRVLDVLNELRSREGVAPVVWSINVAIEAARWATEAPTWGHSSGPYAESICMSSPSGTDGVVDCLYRMYDLEKPLAAAAGADLWGPCSGAGTCNHFNMGHHGFGHFCILMTPCVSRVGIAAATPGWTGGGQFNVFDVA
jgi:hypothetical protein